MQRLDQRIDCFIGNIGAGEHNERRRESALLLFDSRQIRSWLQRSNPCAGNSRSQFIALLDRERQNANAAINRGGGLFCPSRSERKESRIHFAGFEVLNAAEAVRNGNAFHIRVAQARQTHHRSSILGDSLLLQEFACDTFARQIRDSLDIAVGANHEAAAKQEQNGRHANILLS